MGTMQATVMWLFGHLYSSGGYSDGPEEDIHSQGTDAHGRNFTGTMKTGYMRIWRGFFSEGATGW